MKQGIRALGTLLLVAFLTTTGAAYEVGPVTVHGYFSQGYIVSEGNNYIEDSKDGTADFREYGINARMMPLDWLSIGAQVSGREYGSAGNDAIFLDWAVADFRVWDALSFRAGKMRIPNGLYGETRDIDALRTEILLPQSVYVEYQREAYNSVYGAELYGTLPVGDGSLSYQVQVGERDMDPDDGDMARILRNSRAMTEPTDYNMEIGYTVALEWQTPVDGLRFAGTYSQNEYEIEGDVSMPFMPGTLPMTADTTDNINWVLSAEYVVGALNLAAEYTEISFDSEMSFATPAIPTIDLDPVYSGYYIRGAYEVNDWLSAALGYSHFETDEDVDSDDDHQDDVFLSLRFDVTDYFIFKIEEHFISGSLGIFDTENDGDVKDTMSMFLAKASFLF